MVFTSTTMQGQCNTHRRHLFDSMLHQLHPQKARTRLRTQVSGDSAPALTGKPSLEGPPKRPVRPAPPPVPPHPRRDTSKQRDNGKGRSNSLLDQQGPRQQRDKNEHNGRERYDNRGSAGRQQRRDVSRVSSQQPPLQSSPSQAPATDTEASSHSGVPDLASNQQNPDSASKSQAETQKSSSSQQQPTSSLQASPASAPPAARPQTPVPPLSRPPAPPALKSTALARPQPHSHAARQPQRQELPTSAKFSQRSAAPSSPFQPRPSAPSQLPSQAPSQSSQSPAAGQATQPSPAQPPANEQDGSALASSAAAPQAAPAAPPAPSNSAANIPVLAAKPGLRAPPSRPPPIDLDRFDAMRHRSNQRPDQSRQNGNGSNNGAARQPSTSGQAAPIPGAPVAQPLPVSRPSSRGGKRKESDDDDGKGKGKGRKPTGDEGRRKNKTRVDAGSRRVTRAERKQRRAAANEAGRPEKEEILEVGLEGMSVQDLADKLAVAPTEIVKALFMKGIMAQVNQVLDFETVQIAAEEFEVEILEKEEARLDDLARKTMDYVEEEDLEFLQPRPPVVVVMGHVDHGKTSLLDTIRKSKVAAGEAGGITQAIGAYTVGVDTEGDIKEVTFLDTPGHEAFSAMRARGARVTDVAIIVVAADDGVRPQTLEAISHAKAAEVPIVVAINKVDKDGANPERVKQELSEAGLLPEEWGGKTPMIPISAKKGTGVDDLLETVALVAEVEQLMSNPDRAAAGTVLEAHLDRRVGPIATLLVQTGTLRVGDVVVAGSAYGKVRSMKDNYGDKETASPSTAVQMSGLNAVPIAGDDFSVATSLDEGRKVAEVAAAAQRVDRLAGQAGGGSMVTTKSLASFDGDEDEELLQRLNVILKTDASGTLEAVKAALSGLPQGSVVLRYLLAVPNDITESDVDLAAASKGLILGFNVEPSEAVLAAAKHQGVTVRSYRVIYDLLDDMRAAMEGKLAALEQRIPIGEAEVRAVFGKGSKLVAGCMVTEGSLREDCFVVVGLPASLASDIVTN
ncbi:TPA: hypothetical protein ACH3X2_013126 [Trebouxia sp. C0005]